MKFENSSLAKLSLETLQDRITNTTISQSQQLEEINLLIGERLDALATITLGFESFISKINDEIPEKKTWQESLKVAKDFLATYKK